MKLFYQNKLKINDAQLQTLQWHHILDKLVLLQKYHKYNMSKDLDALDITNHIMRKENFMISMFNADLFTFRMSFNPFEIKLGNINKDDDVHELINVNPNNPNKFEYLKEEDVDEINQQQQQQQAEEKAQAYSDDDDDTLT